MTKTLLSMTGLVAAFFTLTAFTIHRTDLSPKDEIAYKKHSVEEEILCGSNDSRNSCYTHRMAKWLNKHGYKAEGAIMMAEMENYPQ